MGPSICSCSCALQNTTSPEEWSRALSSLISINMMGSTWKQPAMTALFLITCLFLLSVVLTAATETDDAQTGQVKWLICWLLWGNLLPFQLSIQMFGYRVGLKVKVKI